MKPFEYYPETDTLEITLSATPATGGAENAGATGEDPDIIFSYDDHNRLVSITVENARQRVDISTITTNADNIIESVQNVYTISELAEEMDITPRALRNTIKVMRDIGKQIGRQAGPTFPIVLTEADRCEIQKWRETHHPGRPQLVRDK